VNTHTMQHVQLLIHEDDHELEARLNPDDDPPVSFEQSGERVYAPELGSEDLVALAAYGRNDGMRVQGFLFCDSRMQLLDERTQGEYSAAVLEEFEARGEAGVRAVLNTDLRGIYVCGVDLYSSDVRKISVMSDGVVRSKKVRETLEFLSSAFKSLSIL